MNADEAMVPDILIANGFDRYPPADRSCRSGTPQAA